MFLVDSFDSLLIGEWAVVLFLFVSFCCFTFGEIMFLYLNYLECDVYMVNGLSYFIDFGISKSGTLGFDTTF